MDFEKPEQLQQQAISEPHEEPTPNSAQSLRIMVYMIAIIGILIAGTLAVGRYSANDIQTVCIGNRCLRGIPSEKYTVNGYDFVKIEELWFTEITRGNKEINTQFHFGPREVDDVSVTGILNATFYNSSVMYITFDPNESRLNATAIASGELQLNLAQAFNIPLQAACMNRDHPSCEIVPEISCATTSNATVIELVQESPTKVVFNGNCVRVQGEDIELVRAVDALLLKWYRVLE